LIGEHTSGEALVVMIRRARSSVAWVFGGIAGSPSAYPPSSKSSYRNFIPA
jgi:hypothetical protein